MKMIIQRQEYERLKHVERQFLEQSSLIEMLNHSVLALKAQINLAHKSIRTACDEAQGSAAATDGDGRR